MRQEDEQVRQLLKTRVIRLNAPVTGVTVGFIAGIGLFLATNILILKGGAVVGPHLELLGQVFIGYRVTFIGSIVGFVYAFVSGGFMGYVGAKLYNWIAARNRPPVGKNERQ